MHLELPPSQISLWIFLILPLIPLYGKRKHCMSETSALGHPHSSLQNSFPGGTEKNRADETMWTHDCRICRPHRDLNQWEAQGCSGLSPLLNLFMPISAPLTSFFSVWTHLKDPLNLALNKAPARLPEALPLITMCFIYMGVRHSHVTGMKWESHCQGNQKWEHVQFQPCPRTQINSVHSHCVLDFLVSHSQGSVNHSTIISAHPSPSIDALAGI